MHHPHPHSPIPDHSHPISFSTTYVAIHLFPLPNHHIREDSKAWMGSSGRPFTHSRQDALQVNPVYSSDNDAPLMFFHEQRGCPFAWLRSMFGRMVVPSKTGIDRQHNAQPLSWPSPSDRPLCNYTPLDAYYPCGLDSIEESIEGLHNYCHLHVLAWSWMWLWPVRNATSGMNPI